MQLVTEKLHNARLEQEKVIVEQQLEQQTTIPHKAQQMSKQRSSQAITLPFAISKDKKKLLVTNSVAQGKTTKKMAGDTKEKSTKLSALSISDTIKPSTSTQLSSVVASEPEKV